MIKPEKDTATKLTTSFLIFFFFFPKELNNDP